eukprot:Clim_evm58s33 gene=Clim_evmTU58s33
MWSTTVNDEHFDGKLAFYPCVEVKAAVRNSRNRAAGTPIMVNKNVNQDLYAKFMSETLIPAIVAQWPVDWDRGRKIRIVHDNAPSHRKVELDDRVVCALLWARTVRGLEIVFVNQPACSPDMNVLDNGVFRSLDANRNRPYAASLEHAVENTTNDWEEYNSSGINKSFDTVGLNLGVVMENGGEIMPRMRHFYKDMAKRHGTFEKLFVVPETVIKIAAAKILELKAEVAALQQGHEVQRAEVANLQQGYEAQQAEIADLQLEHEVQRTEIADLQGIVLVMKDGINDLRQTIRGDTESQTQSAFTATPA